MEIGWHNISQIQKKAKELNSFGRTSVLDFPVLHQLSPAACLYWLLKETGQFIFLLFLMFMISADLHCFASCWFLILTLVT